VVYEVNDKVNWAGVNILDRDAEETTEAIPSSVHLDFTLARVSSGTGHIYSLIPLFSLPNVIS
ncbi:MAG: hypothetical protein WBH69_04625, partial [Fervidobacterium sp.]